MAPVVVASVLLLGCSSGVTSNAPAGGGAAAPPGFPVTVENCGRELTFDRPPTRVITGWQPSIEMMLALGLQDSIIARQGFPQSPLLPEQEAAYNAIQEISSGESGDQTAKKEVTLTLRPDFYFARGSVNVDGARGLATVEDLEANGAKVFFLTCTGHGSSDAVAEETRPTIEVVYQRIDDLGKIFAVPDKAAALVAQMKADIAAVQEKIAGRPAPRVLVSGDWNGPNAPIPVKSDRGFDVSLAGGKNMLGFDQSDGADVSREAVAAFNPEVIIIENYETGPIEPETARNEAFFRSVLPNSDAVKNNQIVGMESIDLVPGIRYPRGVEELAKVFFPDAFR